ncbi:MAG: 16S rRNA (cytosine(1402)-N(4))-methyltransferase RsmH, partial [Bacteroidetes bacterium]|nr:16S rRNA (cytosine(1402)-N(4))-methyltransferase RsmH [Bacteroidota bacterium]
MTQYHQPVMLNECIDALDIKSDGIYVDVTYGGGGHSREILKQLGPKGKLIAFDQDQEALKNLVDDDRLIFINQNFEFMNQHLRYLNLVPVNGILADLGVSSHQFDTAVRGFSFRFDSELDMRMDSNQSLTAKRIIRTYTEESLTRIFRLYGEINNAYNLSRTIVSNRSEDSINTVFQFKELINPCVPKWKENQYLAQVFQALRIEVNRELHVLQKFLVQTVEVLAPKGRLVVMSYHSLEDRLVKNFIQKGNFSGDDQKDFYGNKMTQMKPVNKKPIEASADEQQENNRSRSAKL